VERPHSLRFEKKLKDFDHKLQLLLASQSRLVWEIGQLRKENQKLREQNAIIETNNKEIKKKYKVLEKDFNKSRYFAKIVAGKLTPTGGISELKELIDRHIQDIDACIMKLKETL